MKAQKGICFELCQITNIDEITVTFQYHPIAFFFISSFEIGRIVFAFETRMPSNMVDRISSKNKPPENFSSDLQKLNWKKNRRRVKKKKESKLIEKSCF